MAASPNKPKAQLNPFYIEPAGGGVPGQQQRGRWEGDYWQDDEEGVEQEGLLEYGNNSREPDDNGKGYHPHHNNNNNQYNRNVGRSSPHERKVILGTISLFLILIVAASVRNSDSKKMTKPTTTTSDDDGAGGGLSSSVSPPPKQPSLPYPDRVVFLGERHSGVDFYGEKFRECFPKEVKFESSLTRETMWFQDPPTSSFLDEDEDDGKQETLLFILLVRDPYTWVEAMRTLPPFWNMPDHGPQKIIQGNGGEQLEHLPWEEFVTKPWTHNSKPILTPPSSDDNNNNNNSPGMGEGDGGAGSELTPNDDAGTGEGGGGIETPPTDDITNDDNSEGGIETPPTDDITNDDNSEGGETAPNPNDEVGGAETPGDNDDVLFGLFHDNNDNNSGNNNNDGGAEGGEEEGGGGDNADDNTVNPGNSNSGDTLGLPNEENNDVVPGNDESGGDGGNGEDGLGSGGGNEGGGDDSNGALGGDGNNDDDAGDDDGDDDGDDNELGAEGDTDGLGGNAGAGDDLQGDQGDGNDAPGSEGGVGNDNNDDDAGDDDGDDNNNNDDALGSGGEGVNRGTKDRRGLEEDDAHKCQLGFTEKQVFPCQEPPAGASSQVHLDVPIYELDPVTGETFPNILALRKAKIEHYTNTLVEWYKDRLIGPLVVFHYENTVWFSLEQLAKEFKGSAWAEGIPHHCRNVNIQPPPLDHKLDHIDLAYEPYLTEHIDWQTEEQIGYQPKKH